METFGVTREDFGRLAVAQRQNALLNPNALLKTLLTMEQYLNARVIVSPSHMKRIVAALADNMAKYEKQFGEVKPSEAPTTNPIGFDAQKGN